MKCLSIRQPYAALIVSGQKSIETRTWRTNYRGPLLVQAGRAIDREAMVRLHDRLTLEPICGAAIGVVELVDCRPLEPGDTEAALYPYGPHRFAWLLSKPRRLPAPIPMKGRLGLFEIDSGLAKQVEDALREGTAAGRMPAKEG